MELEHMKKTLFQILLLLLLVAATIMFFQAQNRDKSGSKKLDNKSGVHLAVPPGYIKLDFINNGQVNIKQSVAKTFLNAGKNADKLAIKIEKEGGFTLYLLEWEKDVIRERLVNEYGTIVQTEWLGGVSQRLNFALKAGKFTPPGMPGGVMKNLYH